MPCWSIHQPMSVGRSPGDHRASRYGGLLETFRYALVSWRSFWVGSLGCWWSISAIRCFRFRESSPDPRASGLPGFWRWGLRWFGHVPEICFGVLVEIPWETSWEPSGAEGQFLDSDFWSFGGPGFAMNLLIDVSAYMVLKCWSFFEISFCLTPCSI